MLVLTRRQGEEIVIDGQIKIRIVQAGGGRVRLGFEAPPDVRIRRQELLPDEFPRRADPVPRHVETF